MEHLLVVSLGPGWLGEEGLIPPSPSAVTEAG